MQDSEVMEKFGELLSEIPDFMEEEDRQDAEFRGNVLFDQVGDIARHISHDPELNPNTRPLSEPEEVSYGDAIWQLLCLAHARDVDIGESLGYALERMESREGYSQQSDEIGEAIDAWSPDSDSYTGEVGKDILVVGELSPDEPELRLDDYEVIVTEIGGMTSHAVIISREMGISYAVGVAGVTNMVSEGDTLTVDFNTDTLTVGGKDD